MVIPGFVLVIAVVACLVFIVLVMAEQVDPGIGKSDRPAMRDVCQECGYAHPALDRHICWRCGHDIASRPDRIEEHPGLPNKMWCVFCPDK